MGDTGYSSNHNQKRRVSRNSRSDGARSGSNGGSRGRNHGGGHGGGGHGGGRANHSAGARSNNGNFDSIGPSVRIKGSARQVFEKYQQMAREIRGSDERVLMENYYQHADHYFRIWLADNEREQAQAGNAADANATDKGNDDAQSLKEAAGKDQKRTGRTSPRQPKQTNSKETNPKETRASEHNTEENGAAVPSKVEAGFHPEIGLPLHYTDAGIDGKAAENIAGEGAGQDQPAVKRATRRYAAPKTKKATTESATENDGANAGETGGDDAIKNTLASDSSESEPKRKISRAKPKSKTAPAVEDGNLTL